MNFEPEGENNGLNQKEDVSEELRKSHRDLKKGDMGV